MAERGKRAGGIEADSGTLFMDEIANLPTDMQDRLMRVLQEGEIRPVSSNKAQVVNVRIISASSRSLRDLVDQGQFREDLYYRLLVYPISIPSLAKRRDDIVLLASRFLEKFATQHKKSLHAFDDNILAFLQNRIWPGNVRELENMVERLMAFAPAEATILDASILPPDIRKEFEQEGASGATHFQSASQLTPQSLPAQLQ